MVEEDLSGANLLGEVEETHVSKKTMDFHYAFNLR